MIDWLKLKREVQYFSAAVAFALVLLGVLGYLHDQTARQWQQASNQLSQATLRYQTASDQKTLLENYRQRYTALKRKHVLGAEERIDWIETIQASSTQQAIPSVKFSLDERNIVTPSDINADMVVYASKMKLELNLLHEGDLFRLLADLDDKAQGLYGISGCSLRREGKQTSANVISSTLIGNCDLYWYTMGQNIAEQYDAKGNPVMPEDSGGDEEI